MLKTYELPEEELIREIQDNNRITDTIYLTHKFIKSNSVIARNKLSDIALINYELITETINDYLQIVKDHNAEHLLTVDFSYFFNDVDFKDHEEIKNTEEFKLFDKYAFPLSLRVEDLHFSLILQQLLKYKDLQKVTQYDLLIKSLNASIKYLNFIKVKFDLSDRTITYFTYGLLQRVCTVVFEIFNREEFISYTETIKEMTFKLSELNNKFFNALNNEQIKDQIKREIDQFRIENEHIVTSYTNNIIGVNELIKIKELNLDKFYFEDFKNIIKLRFSPNDKVSYGKSLELSLWIMYLKANKDSDTLPFEDKFILNKMIIPFGDDLKELLGVDFDYSNFNIEEAINYINRLRTEGEYKNTPQGKRYKLLAFKRMFNLTNKKYVKEDAISLNKEVINNDFSVRHDLILEAMGNYGDKNKPFKTKSRNIEVTKIGVKCDIHDKILFDFLLGQFVESGGTPTKVVLRSDLLTALHFDGKGDRFDYIKKSLGAIASQTIFIDDEESKDKATKQIRKSISKEGRKNLKSLGANLFQFEYIEVEGEMAIIFNIPLMKNFCSHKQFGRNISSDIMKHWLQNPRIYLIARELSAIARNKHTDTIKVETLLKNTECWEEYKSYSNKRVYLQRFIKDIETSKKYLLTGVVEYVNFSPSTLKDATIKVK